MVINLITKRTYLTMPLKYTLAKRFGSKGPKLSKSPMPPKPPAPSSLGKTCKKTETSSIPKPTTTSPKPNPSELKGTPKYTSANTYVGGASPHFRSMTKQISPEKNSLLDNPHIALSLSNNQASITNPTATVNIPSMPSSPLYKKAPQPYSGTNTQTSITKPANTTTIISSEPLTSSTGALVLYKSPKTAPIQNNLPTIFIDPHGNASFDNPSSSYSMPPEPIVNVESVDTFLDELLKIQKSIEQHPMEIPKDTKIPNLSQEKDQSIIVQEASRLSKELSNNQIMRELAGRGFIKVAGDNSTRVKSITEETIVIGKAMNNIKIMPFGKGYIDEVEKNTSQPLQSTINTEEPLVYHLAALSIDNEAFLLNGPQKHIVVVYDKDKEIYYGIGYLTSNSFSEDFAKRQFKSYQEAKEYNKELSTMLEGKPQKFAQCRNALLIQKDQLKILKWGTNYIQDLPVDTQTSLSELQKELLKKPMIPYDAKGYSKEILIKACISFDYHIIKKIPHPKTYVQILSEKKNEENKEQFKKEHALKKKTVHDKLYAQYKKEPTTPFNE